MSKSSRSQQSLDLSMISSKSEKISKQKTDRYSGNRKDTSSSTVSTPKTSSSGVKRFLTPSPVNVSDTSKKVRQISGEKLKPSGLPAMEEELTDIDTSSGMAAIGGLLHGSSELKTVATELKELIFPDIKVLIQKEIPDIESIVNKAADVAVSKFSEKLQKEIASVKTENSALRKENNLLNDKVVKLEGRVSELESAVDTGEQYSRRGCLRITGIKEVDGEDTDAIVLKMAYELEAGLTIADLDRSHRVGKIRPGQNRAIIAKFATHRARQSLYSKRKDLRGNVNYANVYINEDLTSTRSRLLFNARQYAKANLVKSAYSSNGNIYVKDKSDTKLAIRSTADLLNIGTLPVPSVSASAAGKTPSSGATGP